MNTDAPLEPITLAITGASGAPYALRLLQMLLLSGHPVYLMISDAAAVVFDVEAGLALPRGASERKRLLANHLQADESALTVLELDDWSAPVASGLGAPRSMVVCPCSGGTLAAIATGSSNNLIHRAADVAIKERGRLILVPRETPLSPIHLDHMARLAHLGVTILPASPGFYHGPESIHDLVDFVVARILKQLEIPQDLMTPWGTGDPDPSA